MTQKDKWKPSAQRYLAYKAVVAAVANERMNLDNRDPIEGPLNVTLYVRLQNPAKRRWDLDNVVKAVLDGCNKIVWKDDKQIVSIYVTIVEPTEEGGIEEDHITVHIHPH